MFRAPDRNYFLARLQGPTAPPLTLFDSLVFGARSLIFGFFFESLAFFFIPISPVAAVTGTDTAAFDVLGFIALEIEILHFEVFLWGLRFGHFFHVLLLGFVRMNYLLER
jgi:hypothetical protein